tara:strand:- start:770 stop:1918 length:1149 start_codon:yes stop_codon:yes gene_type:complete
MKNFKHLSLFSGCGGMDLGIQGGFKVNKEFLTDCKNKKQFFKLPKTKFETVFANDIKKSAEIFWNHNNLNKNKIFVKGSIVDLVKKNKRKNIFPPNIDIVTGGFPCQDFSVSGLRKGFYSHKSHLNNLEETNQDETRGTLYLWMKEVIRITNPKIFIAENVKGITNIGDVFEIIKNDFSNTGKGYKVFSRELYAPDYGIPQSRRRIFFIGVCNEFIKEKKIELDEDMLYPEKEFGDFSDFFENLKKYPTADCFFHDLNEPENEKKDLSQQKFSKAKYMKGSQGQTQVRTDGIAPTIRSEHHGNIEFRYLHKDNGGSFNKQRRLTVRECARIQTFPDSQDFVFNSDYGNLSASEAYKLIGDAVPPLLAYKISKKLEVFLSKYL